MLHFGAAVSTAPDHQQALDEVIPAALAAVEGTPELAVCFFSMEHMAAASGIALSLSERLGTSAIIGCTAEGVIGQGREVEGGPGLALWLARLPGVDVRPFALEVVAVPDGYGIAGWPSIAPDERATVVLLADPFSFPTDRFLERLNEEQAGLPVVGGMASGGRGPGEHRLLSGTDVVDRGAVGVALVGAVEVRTVVSQGCRPIGSPYAVTKGEGNVVHELGGQPAIERLRQVVTTLSQRDQQLIRGGLQVGQVIDEHKAEFGRGDFLIRGLVGADEESGAIAVGDQVELGRTLQFHVRDAAAAGEELELLLAPVTGWDPKGVLLFSCNGRGRRFFGEPDHDAQRVAAATGRAPMAGFFAQGELGPVGRRNFVHGYTASMALFCEPREPLPVVTAGRAAASEPAGTRQAPSGPDEPGTPEPVWPL